MQVSAQREPLPPRHQDPLPPVSAAIPRRLRAVPQFRMHPGRPLPRHLLPLPTQARPRACDASDLLRIAQSWRRWQRLRACACGEMFAKRMHCPSWGPSPRLSRCVCALMPLLCRNVWPLQSVELEAVVEYASKVCSHSVVIKFAPTCLHASCARAPKPRLIYLISPAMAQSLADNRSWHSCEPTRSCEARTMAIASAC